MNRSEMEHVIRAAAAISGDDQIVVIGSQAILGSHPDAPPEPCASRDVDLWPLHHPDRADLVDASIGELSPLHETLLERGAATPLDDERRDLARERIEADFRP